MLLMRGILQKKSEIIFVILSCLIIAIANLWHVILPALQPKPNTVFLGVGHHYEDYFFYLSQFAQGARGALLANNQFTPEAIPQTMMWLTNVWLGKLGGLVGLTPWWSYTLSVFGFSLIYLYLIYKIMARVFPESGLMRVGGFLLATLTTNFYGVNINGGQLTIQPFEFFYHYTSAFNRLGAVPHLILQNILSLGLLLLFMLANSHSRGIPLPPRRDRDDKTNRVFLFLASALASAWLFVINPVSLFLVGLTCGISFIIILVIPRAAEESLANARNNLKQVERSFSRREDGIRMTKKIMLFISCLTLVPVILLFIQLPALRHPFFQNFQTWETGVNPAPLIEVAKSFGPFLLLIILGLPVFLRKNDSLRLTGAVYSILPLILYFSPIPKLLHIPYFRFLQPAAYVFFGAMAVEGIQLVISSGARNLVHNGISLPLSGIEMTLSSRREIKSLIFIGILICFLIVQLPMLHYEIKTRLSNFIIPSPLNYVPVELVKGLQELEKYPAGNVLATNTLELLVPTFSGKKVYSAHRSLTIDYYRKIEEIARFYRLQMSTEEGKEFLTKNNLTYVLWHSTEGDPQLLESHYSFLKKVYQNPQFILFRQLIDNTD